MGRLLCSNEIGEHRSKAIDRICCLALAIREILDRQGKVGSICKRVTIDQK